MQMLIDLHCHLLPYVDDGAQTLAEAQALLARQSEQGVGVVCLTPHWRRKLFETPQAKINQKYQELARYASALPRPIQLRLGREYYCDRSFLAQLAAGEILPIAGSNTVLIEFSRYHHTAEEMCAMVCAVCDAGYRPLIAHVERYQAVREAPALLARLTALGGYCQMNTEGLLGEMGLREKWFCTRLLKQQRESIAVIASDAHRLTSRQANLGDCAALLRKKIPASQWQALFIDNPKKLLDLPE